MPTKFRIGDRVKLTQAAGDFSGLQGVIEEDRGDRFLVFIPGQRTFALQPSQIDLVGPLYCSCTIVVLMKNGCQCGRMEFERRLQE